MIKKIAQSIHVASQGILYTFREEKNFRVHQGIALGAVAFAWYCGISAAEWAMVILCIALVSAAEIFNTAIERLVDLVEPEHNPAAGRIKDIAAGGVLFISLGAAMIGVVVFWPHIQQLF